MRFQRESARAGRISVKVRIRNLLEPDHILTCDARVDTGSAYLVLPRAWKDSPANQPTARHIDCETAAQPSVQDEVCGPVQIRLEGFEPVPEIVGVTEAFGSGGFPCKEYDSAS